MKIIRLYYLLPPNKGGMEKHIKVLSKIQSKENLVDVYFNNGEKININDVEVLPKLKLFKIKRFTELVVDKTKRICMKKLKGNFPNL